MTKHNVREPVAYKLTGDIDIAGMIWREGASIFALNVKKNDVDYVDVFLTHKKEYAKRGSHAPVTRLRPDQIEIDGEQARLVIEDQPI